MTKYEKKLENRVEELEKKLEEAVGPAADFNMMKGYIKHYIYHHSNNGKLLNAPGWLVDMIEKIEDKDIKKAWDMFYGEQKKMAKEERLLREGANSKKPKRRFHNSWGLH